MPVREMVYDALNYAAQVKVISDRHRRDKDYRDSSEFLSGLLREDRLAPVITIACIMGQGNGKGRGSFMTFWISRKNMKI